MPLKMLADASFLSQYLKMPLLQALWFDLASKKRSAFLAGSARLPIHAWMVQIPVIASLSHGLLKYHATGVRIHEYRDAFSYLWRL
jgi:hypothetical protein